jgi:hypothetical protein
MRSSSCFVAWKKKKKKGKKKPLNYIANFLSRAFSQGPSFFTLFFIGALNGKSLPCWHLWWACPPPSRYIFLLSSNFVRRMYHPTENSYRYTRGRDRNILVYKRVVVSLFFFLFVLLRLSIHMAYIFVCLFARLYLSDAVFAIISSGF